MIRNKDKIIVTLVMILFFNYKIQIGDRVLSENSHHEILPGKRATDYLCKIHKTPGFPIVEEDHSCHMDWKICEKQLHLLYS